MGEVTRHATSELTAVVSAALARTQAFSTPFDPYRATSDAYSPAGTGVAAYNAGLQAAIDSFGTFGTFP